VQNVRYMRGGRRWCGTTPAIRFEARARSSSPPATPIRISRARFRKGDNRWSDSIVRALDLHTGKFKWGYQEIKHDVWDYDRGQSGRAGSTCTWAVKRSRPAGEAGKSSAGSSIVDRRTGKLIRRSDKYVAMTKNMFTDPPTDRQRAS